MEATEQAILDDLNAVIARAQAAGLVVTITLEHQQPLAMGNYAMVPAVRPARQPSLTLNLCGIDMSAGDDSSVVVEVSDKGVRIPGAVWPDPETIQFDYERRDPFNPSLRTDDDKPKRRRTD